MVLNILTTVAAFLCIALTVVIFKCCCWRKQPHDDDDDDEPDHKESVCLKRGHYPVQQTGKKSPVKGIVEANQADTSGKSERRQSDTSGKSERQQSDTSGKSERQQSDTSGKSEQQQSATSGKCQEQQLNKETEADEEQISVKNKIKAFEIQPFNPFSNDNTESKALKKRPHSRVSEDSEGEAISITLEMGKYFAKPAAIDKEPKVVPTAKQDKPGGECEFGVIQREEVLKSYSRPAPPRKKRSKRFRRMVQSSGDIVDSMEISVPDGERAVSELQPDNNDSISEQKDTTQVPTIQLDSSDNIKRATEKDSKKDPPKLKVEVSLKDNIQEDNKSENTETVVECLTKASNGANKKEVGKERKKTTNKKVDNIFLHIDPTADQSSKIIRSASDNVVLRPKKKDNNTSSPQRSSSVYIDQLNISQGKKDDQQLLMEALKDRFKKGFRRASDGKKLDDPDTDDTDLRRERTNSEPIN